MARGSFPPHFPTTVGTCHVVLLGPLFTCSVLLWKTCLRTIPLRGLHPFFLSHCFCSRAALGHSSNSRLVSKPLTFLQYSIPLMAPERAPDYVIIGGGTSFATNLKRTRSGTCGPLGIMAMMVKFTIIIRQGVTVLIRSMGWAIQ